MKGQSQVPLNRKALMREGFSPLTQSNFEERLELLLFHYLDLSVTKTNSILKEDQNCCFLNIWIPYSKSQYQVP